MRRLVLAIAMLAAVPLIAQQVNTKPSKTKAPISVHPDIPGESSSKDTQVDLSPPKGDAKAHPNSEATDVGEMHPYNPMKAMKDVEVGDYYFSQKNYVAAISRYREALDYKPHDAVATFALAKALEKSKDLEGARDTYEDYLKILPNGPQAAECHKAIERIDKTQSK